MNYPLDMKFRILAFAPQISVIDAGGATICYVQQKMFRLKEAVNVFTDQSKKQLLCEIKSDRVIDFSACYSFFDTSGEKFGSVSRKGMRSLWKAHYEINDEDGNRYASISEENPMAKVFDSLLGEIPVVGLLCGYFFHPMYLGTSVNGSSLFRLTKQRSFLESSYKIDKLADADPVEELRALMSMIMMALLERRRG